MCLIALAWQANERFPFVIAANRDEFLDRPTAALAKWTTDRGHEVIGGRDLRDGGAWMAFSAQGRFAMLTNVRNPNMSPPTHPTSRGHLVLSWLESSATVQVWIDSIDFTRYQGFNLIVGDWRQRTCFYLSNQASRTVREARSAHPPPFHTLAPGGIYGLSNAALDTPWPKTVTLKQRLAQSMSVSRDHSQLAQECLVALKDSQAVSDDLLPNTGVPKDWERALSSAYVRFPNETSPQYGTRTSLVASVSQRNELSLTEITHATKQTARSTSRAKAQW